eukprot:CAMPEP_0181292344 /NCGR_PEP_ID=MMETSP1101-20121128/2457_1 /TAXON_ID=46948 /ORGANISM="Rhodomonas abbreviata, Strain Caron Lab Isolate" /LENGTH=192 /DNA_ID=CAMNT_0023396809 /DNA_START=46 /DNA_END=624 /DNA_ORIENTATION=+
MQSNASSGILSSRKESIPQKASIRSLKYLFDKFTKESCTPPPHLEAAPSISSSHRHGESTNFASVEFLQASDFAIKGDTEALKKISKQRDIFSMRDPSGGQSICHKAAANGRIETLKWLASECPSILKSEDRIFRSLPVHFAARCGKIEAVQLLLDLCPESAFHQDVRGKCPRDVLPIMEMSRPPGRSRSLE